MQISNSTGQSTSYRVTGGSGLTAASGGETMTTSGNSTATLEGLDCGVLDPLEGQESSLADSSDWTVEFYIAERLVAARTFAAPPPQVSLMETAGQFWVDATPDGAY
jgi:hypothetical protein